MSIQAGDTIEYWEAWRNTLQRGTVIEVHTSPKGFEWLQVSGRERLLPADRVERIVRQRKEAA